MTHIKTCNLIGSSAYKLRACVAYYLFGYYCTCTCTCTCIHTLSYIQQCFPQDLSKGGGELVGCLELCSIAGKCYIITMLQNVIVMFGVWGQAPEVIIHITLYM